MLDGAGQPPYGRPSAPAFEGWRPAEPIIEQAIQDTMKTFETTIRSFADTQHMKQGVEGSSYETAGVPNEPDSFARRQRRYALKQERRRGYRAWTPTTRPSRPRTGNLTPDKGLPQESTPAATPPRPLTT